MVKERAKIPQHIADSLLAANRHTCCICRERKDVRIHHIDGKRSNNDPETLLVVCENCHSDVHSKPGFGRRFTRGEVRIYKKNWEDHCKLEDTKKNVIKNAFVFVNMYPNLLDMSRWGEVVSNIASGTTIPEVYQFVKASAEIVRESTGDPSSGDQFEATVFPKGQD
jgi:hypothetical protein